MWKSVCILSEQSALCLEGKAPVNQCTFNLFTTQSPKMYETFLFILPCFLLWKLRVKKEREKRSRKGRIVIYSMTWL